MVFADGFSMVLTMKYNVQIICNQGIPIRMFIDSLSLFNVVS